MDVCGRPLFANPVTYFVTLVLRMWLYNYVTGCPTHLNVKITVHLHNYIYDQNSMLVMLLYYILAYALSIFKPGARLQLAKHQLWARTWFTEIIDTILITRDWKLCSRAQFNSTVHSQNNTPRSFADYCCSRCPQLEGLESRFIRLIAY